MNAPLVPPRAISPEEALSLLGAIRRARRILNPYAHGLFATPGETALEIDSYLARAQLLAGELAPKPAPARDR